MLYQPSVNAIGDDEYISRAFADAIKANDPAHYRSNRASDISLSPPSPRIHCSVSGRRSVTGRPSSVTSSTSAISATARASQRSPRSASRTSDVFIGNHGRVEKSLEVGDNVRVESLGFEGTLRFLGEIDGKAGCFAGVELGGGFAGKGKNDGSVNGCVAS